MKDLDFIHNLRFWLLIVGVQVDIFCRELSCRFYGMLWGPPCYKWGIGWKVSSRGWWIETLRSWCYCFFFATSICGMHSLSFVTNHFSHWPFMCLIFLKIEIFMFLALYWDPFNTTTSGGPTDILLSFSSLSFYKGLLWNIKYMKTY